MNTLILLCGGSGSRMKHFTTDKVLFPVAGKPLFLHSLEKLLATNFFSEVVIPYRSEEQKELLEQALEKNHFSQKVTFVPGGTERMYSVFNALQTVKDSPFVVIHDAARPILEEEFLKTLIQAVQVHKTAVAAKRCTDTMKQVPAQWDETSAIPLSSIDRSRLWHIETPQAFSTELIRSAYQYVIDNKTTITDDSSALTALGRNVFLQNNPFPNPKFTTPSDRFFIEHLLQQVLV